MYALFPLLVTVSATVSVPQDAVEPLWYRQLHGVTALGGLVATDGAQGVYLAASDFGAIGGPHLGSSDVVLARYDIDGAPIWTRQIGSSGFESVRGITEDGAGGIYVVGATQGDFGGPLQGETDAYVGRVDAMGQLLWTRKVASNFADSFVAVVGDGVGGCFGLVSSNGAPVGAPVSGSADVVLVRYDAAGNRLWGIQFGSPDFDSPAALALESSGGVLVVGSSPGSAFSFPLSGTGSSWILRIDGNGVFVSGARFGGSSDAATAVASDGAGGAFVAGNQLQGTVAIDVNTFVARFDGTWNRTWTATVDTFNRHTIPAAVVASVAQEVVVAGTVFEGILIPGTPSVLQPEDGFVARFDGAGAPLSRDAVGGGDQDDVRSLALDGDAGLWVGGLTSSALGGPDPQFFDSFVGRIGRIVGTTYCAPAVLNSSGAPGRMVVAGSDEAVDDALTLVARDLPHATFGYFLTSRTTGFVPMAGGGQGTLCLGGSVGRYNRPGEVGSTNPEGSLKLRLDLTSTPQATGAVSVVAGETWHYQAWFRDANPTATSNMTDAVAVTFR